MRKILGFLIAALIVTSCGNSTGETEKKDDAAADTEKKAEQVVSKPTTIDEATFRAKVFDYTSEKKFKYLGEKPCIIDFYADWCAPCRKLAPILEAIAAEYGEKLIVYKINTDHNQQVSQYLNISSIPAVLLCPMNGDPQMMVGLYPKQEYINAIEQVLFPVAPTTAK
ncbi:MAG TPA: thioredoxin domain-containing protein [Bacteroidales bacterium]|nr:redoxin domain-containing protein [Bacteroidales bacterium]HNZ42405.1 thioredoxin domain-containing protein [Bacteroidales bacterium]HOH83078.1 thioredoxin domain-containing protein [Bacteroidales bacterium]HPB24683.1 thioredoxin domain-containing protein [Bacteroidales bacterium]HPI29110.1 thioredoxin domain-containing protein [Bacteroidales bacterium]